MVSNLPLLWKDSCTIKGKTTTTKTNGATGFVDSVICESEPCKLSFYPTNSNNNALAQVGYQAASVFQQAKLFIRPDLDIPEGCSITVVTHKNGKTFHYKSTGTPMFFTDHQEIVMEVNKEWA